MFGTINYKKKKKQFIAQSVGGANVVSLGK